MKKDFVSKLKSMDQNQELGLFLEITPDLARDAGVTYNKTDAWHRATSLFLSGYSQNDRKKLIDTYFKKFKDTFTYYPKSVGAWWVDAYSLSYMQKKYGITGVLGMSDQYDLDGYQLWGSWWSVPYYPSKLHAAVPAQNPQEKLNVVTFRWAPREPLNGYNNSLKFTPSMYSLQDYATIGLNEEYFSNLLQTYALQKPYNTFGHATVGLEGDLGAPEYALNFSKRLDVVKALIDEDRISVVTMKDFSTWYMKRFPALSPTHIIEKADLLTKTSKKALWVNTPFYRVGFVYNPENNQSDIVDARPYYKNLEEPFFKSPNKQLRLPINLPFVIDTVILPTSKIRFNLGALKDISSQKLEFEKGVVEFEKQEIKLPNKILKLQDTFPVSPEGELLKEYSLTIPFAITRRLTFLPANIFFPILNTYFISQAEADALSVLKKLPNGKVLVYNKSCVKCTFESKYKPAAAAGVKSYINSKSNKHVVIDNSFLLSASSKKAKSILQENNIRYLYLTKYEDYIETLPFLPQDLGLVRVYENAQVEIWKTK